VAQTTTHGVIAFLLFLVMWIGGFFVARGIARVGRPLVEGALGELDLRDDARAMSRSAGVSAGRWLYVRWFT
jgi:hypothetical protein